MPGFPRALRGSRPAVAARPPVSFTHGGQGHQPAVKTGPKRVVVHPDGTIEIHGHQPAKAAPVAAAVAAALPVVTGGHYALTNGNTDAGYNIHRKPKPVTHPAAARVPVRAPVVAPLSIQQQAQAVLDPVKQSILDAINQRVGAQQQAITGYSKDLAGLMGSYGPASQAIYGRAQAGQAATDAALGQTLAGAGGAGQAELAAQLAKIDADPATAARLNAAAGANTAGASGAFAAQGAASLSDLISRGASAQDYGAKQPGIAGLYGLQATKTAQSQGTTDTANAVSQLEQQLPNVIQQIQQNRQQTRANNVTQAVAASQLTGKVPKWAAKILGANPGDPTLQATTAAATDARGRASLAQRAAYDDARLKVSQQNADTAEGRARTAAARAAFDAVKKAHPALTPGQVATITQKAATDAEDLYHGKTHKNSQGVDIVDANSAFYAEAIKTLQNKYPALGRAAVLKLVNSWYPAGGVFPGTDIPNGRPAKPWGGKGGVGPTLKQAGR